MRTEFVLGGLAAGIVFAVLEGYGSTIIPLLIIGGVLVLLLQRTGLKGLWSKVGLKQKSAPIEPVRFEDVGGQRSAKKELSEALEFLHDREAVRQLGIRPLKGILLSGPPGTGKTLLAKASATHTDSAFISASGSEFIEMYAGVGAQRIRRLFEDARKEARRQDKSSAIIFIDEIEVLGGKRGRHSSHLEYDQTVNQLLVEMDGLRVDTEIRLLVAAATNRVDLLDEALLRPGRFDRVVTVDLPDRSAREEILTLHTNNKPLAEEVSLSRLAKETFGFSGAHLESLANEAAILAMRAGEEVLRFSHFSEAIDKVLMGEKLDRRPDDEERFRVAVHEAGHALVGERLRPGSVSGITLTSRGQALGYVRSRPDEDRYLQTKFEIEDQLAIALAGATAEEMILGSRSTGVQGDLDQAFTLARRLILSGMSSFGVVAEDIVPKSVIHDAVSEVITAAEERSRSLLKADRECLQSLADYLVAEESIDGPELRQRIELSPVQRLQ